MREQLHENQVVRIVNLSARDTVKILHSVLRVSPESTLQGIGSSTATADLADVISSGVIEPIDWVLSSSTCFFFDDPLRILLCTVIVEDHNITFLVFLVIDERQYVDVSELGECWVLEDSLHSIPSLDIAFLLFQSGKHLEVFVCGQLERAITIGL